MSIYIFYIIAIPNFIMYRYRPQKLLYTYAGRRLRFQHMMYRHYYYDKKYKKPNILRLLYSFKYPSTSIIVVQAQNHADPVDRNYYYYACIRV